MVARITTPHSIQRTLNYNEQKIKNNQAELLHAANYLKDAEQLNFYEKLNRFTDLIRLNERAKTNTLHISLNFHNSDMLSKEKITEIAVESMDKIGFSEQPFLIYEHHDSGHTHLHIVTTNIQADGNGLIRSILTAINQKKQERNLNKSISWCKLPPENFRRGNKALYI